MTIYNYFMVFYGFYTILLNIENKIKIK